MIIYCQKCGFPTEYILGPFAKAPERMCTCETHSTTQDVIELTVSEAAQKMGLDPTKLKIVADKK